MNSTNFSLLVQNMLRDDFYPHPVQSPLELIQTHISYIFLTGDYVYKLKKPVNFGFLDFSTPAKRHHFTQEELRLNQPLAPDIYLEVLPINYQSIVTGEGEVQEYVLKMRQFPQKNLLINLVKNQALLPKHCQELGEVLANFHQNTPTNQYITSFGTPENIAKAILENYEHTAKYVGSIQTEQQYLETKAFTDNFIKTNTEVFVKRQTQGKIRECHGDLHLKNICLYQDKIQLFDRIEFNEEFRYVDVIYDVAFTMMDLDFNQASDLGNIFLNTYLEKTGDWEGVAILPLYLSRQAYVRAKVNSLTQDNPQLDSTERGSLRLDAEKYYNLAWQYSQPQPGKIILMSGLSGSGKTTVAKKIAPLIKAILIRSDAVRKHLAGISLESRGGEEIYTAAMSNKTYQRLLELGIKLAKQGFTVILDAKYDRLQWRLSAADAAKTENIPLEIYYCTAPLEVLRERIEQRQGDISDATSELLTQQLASQEEFTEREKHYLTVIDTNQNNWGVSIFPEKG